MGRAKLQGTPWHYEYAPSTKKKKQKQKSKSHSWDEKKDKFDCKFFHLGENGSVCSLNNTHCRTANGCVSFRLKGGTVVKKQKRTKGNNTTPSISTSKLPSEANKHIDYVNKKHKFDFCKNCYRKRTLKRIDSYSAEATTDPSKKGYFHVFECKFCQTKITFFTSDLEVLGKKVKTKKSNKKNVNSYMPKATTLSDKKDEVLNKKPQDPKKAVYSSKQHIKYAEDHFSNYCESCKDNTMILYRSEKSDDTGIKYTHHYKCFRCNATKEFTTSSSDLFADSQKEDTYWING